jgi:hypothetical protein
MEDDLFASRAERTPEYYRRRFMSEQTRYLVWLADAEQHIVKGERCVSRHLQRVRTRQAKGLDTAEAERQLLVTQAGLADWQNYRAHLLRIIEQMNDRSSSSALARTTSRQSPGRRVSLPLPEG